MFFYHLQAGIHDAWWLGQWDSYGYLFLSLLLIYTNDSLYEIALANGEWAFIPDALLREINRRPCWPQIIFLYFVVS